jgi:CRP/FNR family transcriptional regulator, cyclic AMP receptor protein
VFETVQEKSIFRELVLIDDRSRSATAVAITDVTMVPISPKRFAFSVSETLFSLNVIGTVAWLLRGCLISCLVRDPCR